MVIYPDPMGRIPARESLLEFLVLDYKAFMEIFTRGRTSDGTMKGLVRQEYFHIITPLGTLPVANINNLTKKVMEILTHNH